MDERDGDEAMNDDEGLGPLTEEAPVTEEERAAAEALAEALEKPSAVRPGSDAAFALAMRASHHTEPASELVTQQALDLAIEERGRSRRARTWWPVLLAAVVLLVAVPMASRLVPGTTSVPETVVLGLPTADAILGVPPEDDQRASERLDILTRARARSYCEGRARDGLRGGR